MTNNTSSKITQAHWTISGFGGDITASGWIGFNRFQYCFNQYFETMKGSQFEKLFEKIIRVLESLRLNTEFDGVVFWMHDSTCVFQYTRKAKLHVFQSVTPATAKIHSVPTTLTNNQHVQYHCITSRGVSNTTARDVTFKYLQQCGCDETESNFLSALTNHDWDKQSVIAIGDWYLTVDILLPIVFGSNMPVATPRKTLYLQTNIFSGPNPMIDYVIMSIKKEMIIRSDWTETIFEDLRTRMIREVDCVWDSCAIRLGPGHCHIDGYLISGNIPEQIKSIPIEELLSTEETAPVATEEQDQSKTIDTDTQYISPVLLDALSIVKNAMNSHPDARKLIQSYLDQ